MRKERGRAVAATVLVLTFVAMLAWAAIDTRPRTGLSVDPITREVHLTDSAKAVIAERQKSESSCTSLDLYMGGLWAMAFCGERAK